MECSSAWRCTAACTAITSLAEGGWVWRGWWIEDAAAAAAAAAEDTLGQGGFMAEAAAAAWAAAALDLTKRWLEEEVIPRCWWWWWWWWWCWGAAVVVKFELPQLEEAEPQWLLPTELRLWPPRLTFRGIGIMLGWDETVTDTPLMVVLLGLVLISATLLVVKWRLWPGWLLWWPLFRPPRFEDDDVVVVVWGWRWFCWWWGLLIWSQACFNFIFVEGGPGKVVTRQPVSGSRSSSCSNWRTSKASQRLRARSPTQKRWVR